MERAQCSPGETWRRRLITATAAGTVAPATRIITHRWPVREPSADLLCGSAREKPVIAGDTGAVCGEWRERSLDTGTGDSGTPNQDVVHAEKKEGMALRGASNVPSKPSS